MKVVRELGKVHVLTARVIVPVEVDIIVTSLGGAQHCLSLALRGGDGLNSEGLLLSKLVEAPLCVGFSLAP